MALPVPNHEQYVGEMFVSLAHIKLYCKVHYGIKGRGLMMERGDRGGRR